MGDQEVPGYGILVTQDHGFLGERDLLPAGGGEVYAILDFARRIQPGQRALELVFFARHGDRSPLVVTLEPTEFESPGDAVDGGNGDLRTGGGVMIADESYFTVSPFTSTEARTGWLGPVSRW